MVDYYKILGVPRDATTSQIKTRYQYLARKYHPDHNGTNRAMSLINEAYGVLSNPRSRFQYNQRLDFQNAHQGTKSISHSSIVNQDITNNNVVPREETNPNDKSTKFRLSPIFGLLAAILVGVFIFASITSNHASHKNTVKLQTVKQNSPSSQSTAPANTSSSTNSNSLALKLQQDEAKVKQEQAIAQQDRALAQQDMTQANLDYQQAQNYGNAGSYNNNFGSSTGSSFGSSSPVQPASAPDSSPYAWASGMGDLNGTYYYAVSYVTSSGNETSLSPPSLGVTANNQEIWVSNLPTSSNSSVTERNLYRTKADGSMAGPFYLVTTIYDNSSTSYVDNTPDSYLTELAP